MTTEAEISSHREALLSAYYRLDAKTDEYLSKLSRQTELDGATQRVLAYLLRERGIDTGVDKDPELNSLIDDDLQRTLRGVHLRVPPSRPSRPGTRSMSQGAVWAVGGLAVTGFTYLMASGGGMYVVAYGAIFIGTIQFLVGLVQYLREGAAGGPDRPKSGER